MLVRNKLKPILTNGVSNTHGATKTAEVLDDVKAIGYKYSTRGAISVSISDMKVPDEKKQILADALRLRLTRSQRCSDVAHDRGGEIPRCC